MSHSFTSHGVHFNYDPDFGGMVNIRLGASDIEIPGYALLEFVWECYEKPKRIDKLELMSWEAANG